MKYLIRAVIVTTLFVVFTNNAKAQTAKPTYELSASTDIDVEDYISFLGHDNDNFYVFRITRERRNSLGFLEAYSRKKLVKIFSSPLNVPTTGTSQFKVYNLVFLDSVINIFYGFYDLKEKTSMIAVMQFDMNGKAIGDMKELMRANGNKLKTDGNMHLFHDYKSHYTMLVLDQKIEKNRGTYVNPTLFLKLVSPSLKTVYAKEVLMTPGDLYNWNLGAIDNKGIAYFINYDYSSKKRVVGITVYDGVNEKLKTTATTISGMWGLFSNDKKGNVYYAERKFQETDDKTDSIKLIKVNIETGAVIEKTSAYTSAEPGEKYKEGKPNFLRSYFLKNLSVNDDGSVKLIMERVVYTGPAEDNGPGVDLRFDASLKLNSMTYMEKKQNNLIGEKTINSFNGAISFYKEETAYFFYNETAENINRSFKDLKTVNRNEAIGGSTQPSCAIINKEGKTEKFSLISKPEKNKYFIIRPDWFYMIDDKEVITVYETDRNLGFARIDLH